MSLLWFLIVGVIAGWLAGQVVKGSGFGVVGDMAVGVCGALVGGLLFGHYGNNGALGPSILVSTIGAIIFLVIVRLFSARA